MYECCFMANQQLWPFSPHVYMEDVEEINNCRVFLLFLPCMIKIFESCMTDSYLLQVSTLEVFNTLPDDKF